jgi:ribonuclease R
MTKRRDAKTAARSSLQPSGMPTKIDIVRYIGSAQGKVGKREITRAFNIRGADRIALKALLQEMAEDGTLIGNRKDFKQPGKIPPTGLFDIVSRDQDGDLLAEPVDWGDDDGPRPRLLVKVDGDQKRAGSVAALGVGDRILARSERLEYTSGDITHSLMPLKRLPKEKNRAVGIFHREARGGGRIDPVDKKEMRAWRVPEGREGNAREGDLVRFDLTRAGRLGPPEAAVVEVLGNPNDQRQISLIAVHTHGIPDSFSPRVLAEVDTLPALSQAPLEDWRDLPLITIDPADARDHDDAVHAAADGAADNAGGFIATIAIADVAYYVRPGTALDREASIRGNSVYFPDRVVPMLPERISNDLCSLRELEDRPALAVRIVFDKAGAKRRHTFHRILMRSAAKLSYQEAQDAIDGKTSPKAAALVNSVLAPLWAAYAALARARDARGPLNLDLPERKILLDSEGRVANVVVPERLDAHRLIEEFMIQANVAAAETLEERKHRCVYRVHEPPSKEKLDSLRDFLATLDMKLPQANTLAAANFNGILAAAKALPANDLVNEVVLRSQSQAVYSPENKGHFGLNLRRYAHFTSPIRRYADLLVHRALVRALTLGPGAITDEQLSDLDAISQQISQAERRAMAAERDTIDRLIAFHLADRVGAEFPARISGVTKSGLFVRLRDTGADGFIPISTLGDEYFRHIDTAHALVGERTGLSFCLGDVVTVKLVEAVPMAGALRFQMISDGTRRSLTAQPKGIRGQRRLRAKSRRQ